MRVARFRRARDQGEVDRDGLRPPHQTCSPRGQGLRGIRAGRFALDQRMECGWNGRYPQTLHLAMSFIRDQYCGVFTTAPCLFSNALPRRRESTMESQWHKSSRLNSLPSIPRALSSTSKTGVDCCSLDTPSNSRNSRDAYSGRNEKRAGERREGNGKIYRGVTEKWQENDCRAFQIVIGHDTIG